MPKGWQGAFALLAIIFVLSSFLDNIAAAIIGATIASKLFQKKVHIGYLAAIVAASNAGGSGSVVGDTTTTMMWLAGVPPIEVFHAYIAAIVALFVSGYFAAKQQHAYQPLIVSSKSEHNLDWSRIVIVFVILAIFLLIKLEETSSNGRYIFGLHRYSVRVDGKSMSGEESALIASNGGPDPVNFYQHSVR